MYSIVQYPDNIFQLHDSIILCFFSDVRYRFRTNWQYRYYQHPNYIHNLCLRHPSISYHLYFINCNNLASAISWRDWHTNVILEYDGIVTILTLEMNHMDEFFLSFFLFCFCFGISFLDLYTSHQKKRYKDLFKYVKTKTIVYYHLRQCLCEMRLSSWNKQ